MGLFVFISTAFVLSMAEMEGKLLSVLLYHVAGMHHVLKAIHELQQGN